MASNGNERFNAEAAAWDSNPDVHVASEMAMQAILKAHPNLKDHPTNKPSILEIGCGTGLLSFRMAPYASTLVAVDASEGMIHALKLKLEKDSNAPRNVVPLCVMLEDPEDTALPPASNDSNSPRQKFDLILSHLVLHHIADLPSVLKTMHGCLKPGGWIALTDYEDCGPQSRKFHPEAKMAGVERHGIDRKWFEGIMKEQGFAEVKVDEGFRMGKDIEKYPGEWGQKKPEGVELEKMDFPFLLCQGRKAL